MKIRDRMADIFDQYPYDAEMQQECIEREWASMMREQNEIKQFARQNRCDIRRKGVYAFKLHFDVSDKIHSVVTISKGCCEKHRVGIQSFIENSVYHFLA